MTTDVDREHCQAELEACAEEVFDALNPVDLAALLAEAGSRAALRENVVERAVKVSGKLANAVRPDERRLLVAACLSWGRSRAGVAKNTGHAVKKFLRYRRCADVPVGALVRTDRIIPNDERATEVLAVSLRVRTGLSETGAVREPDLILNLVIPAIVAALDAGPGRSPGREADLVATAHDVFSRGAELAAAHRVARRLARVASTDLPVAGNVDFVVRIAAYRLAVEERLGKRAFQPLDVLDQAVDDLLDILRKAMTRPTSRWNRRGSDEPDVVAAIDQYARHLGAACGDEAGRRAVSAVHSVLSYRLGLGDGTREIAVKDVDTLIPPLGHGGSLSNLPEAEHLVGWLIAALFRGAGPDAREPLLDWLEGKSVPDGSKDLPLLVRRLRVAGRMLNTTPRSHAPRPVGLTASRFQALTTRLAAAVDPGDITGHPQHDAHRVILSALPPLWTGRRPVVLLVTAHLRVLLGAKQSAGLQAALVAGSGVRAPMQFTQKTSALPDRCCPEAAGEVRSAAGEPREPVHYGEVCPHRPWGEVGWVENYGTLGEASGSSTEAARRQLARYGGPWAELLWH